MGGNKYCTVLKNKIIEDFRGGMKQGDISNKYNMHKSTVSRIIKKFVLTGSVETCHKGGRPRKTTAREDMMIIRAIKKHPEISSKDLKNQMQLPVDSSTVRRRALEANLRSYRRVKKPFISEKNRKRRLEFARLYGEWTSSQWKTVLFSDESKFNLNGSDGIHFVRRPVGKRLDPRYTAPTVKHGGGGVMVWGCFSAQGAGPIRQIEGIMTAQVYRDILQETMFPYAEEEMPLIWRFQHDNDPKHTSNLVKKWLQKKEIQVLDWPAQSPDLNPIENLWEIIKRKIGKKKIQKKDDLYREIEEEWKATSSTIIINLIESMPKRCQAVIKNNGYATKY